VRVETIEGTWPNAAVETRACDVVVCGHVLYNVQDLVPFLRALEDHARRRIVAEITAEHPWAWMNDLWRRFHDLERPTSPTAGDAVEVLRGMGFEPHVEERVAEPQPVGFERRADAIALIRRRMCLTAGRDGEVAEALGNRLRQTADLWSAGPATTALVTIWWDAPAGGRPRDDVSQLVRRAT
jgi:hypothetical protein